MRIPKTILMMLLTILMVGIPSFAQNTKEQESRKAKLEKDIAIIDAQLKENSKKTGTAQSSLALVQKQIENRRELLAESEKEINRLNGQIASKQAEIDIIQARLDTLSAYYSKLVKSAYKNRDAKVWYMYILSSDNIGQAFRRIGYLRGLSGKMNTQAEKIMAAKEELEKETQKLLVLKDEAEALRQQREKEMANLRAEEAQSKTLIASLQKEKSKYQNELTQKRRQMEALNREIQKIIREATQQQSKNQSKSSSSNKSSSSKNSSSSNKTVIDQALNTEFAKNKGKLPWPVDGPVVDKYGQRYHPVYKNVKLPFNDGIGIAVSPGTQVKAIFDGVVQRIAIIPGYNQCVIVQHGNYFSLYCKLGNTSVKVGDKIKTGQVLGTVDTINGETQLHLQIWNGTSPQNPELWLKK
ncbi:MAG: peptidoglycan DD-metalloendopeptidase family protein [Bacteroidales bacterium]|nr:peptidoglycan DD-metalloendopeptidase family protein [Bacteroidales bacterium]